MKKLSIFFLVIGLLTSCKEVKKEKEKEPIKVEQVAVDNSESSNMHKVVVLEKIEASGYIYLKVKEHEKEYWMAIPVREIELGATYYYSKGMEMKNFESKTLNRTFKSVVFAQGVSANKGEVKEVKKRIVNKGESKVVNIEKVPNGIQIATLFKNPKVYQNKQVVIKGQVMKVNNGIMGVNFIHLQDGTKGAGQYDLTITSDDKFKIGDVVTIKGTVVLDKDFGSGYVYDILVEKAKVL